MNEQPVETTLYSLKDSVPSASDKRQSERHLTLLRVGIVTVGDRRELCMIRNISAGGMLIRSFCKLKKGTSLSVELKQGEQIPGKVNWVRDGCAGIQFDSPVDVVGLLTASLGGPRPRMPRVEVRCIVSVRQGSKVYGLLARDVSQGGIKVETSRELDLGSDVVVTLPGMPPRAGLVRWSDSGSCGITFNQPIPLSELVAWLQAQRELLRKAG